MHARNHRAGARLHRLGATDLAALDRQTPHCSTCSAGLNGCDLNIPRRTSRVRAPRPMSTLPALEAGGLDQISAGVDSSELDAFFCAFTARAERMFYQGHFSHEIAISINAACAFAAR